MDKNFNSKKIKLYSFCVPEDYLGVNELIITLDESLQDIFALTQHIGKSLYEHKPFKNLYQCREEFKYHFGGDSPDAFNDYLTTYINNINKEISIRFNFISKGSDVTDKQVFNFIDSIVFCQNHNYVDNRVSLFLSNNVLTNYLNETIRLHHLDTKPEDYV